MEIVVLIIFGCVIYRLAPFVYATFSFFNLGWLLIAIVIAFLVSLPSIFFGIAGIALGTILAVVGYLIYLSRKGY